MPNLSPKQEQFCREFMVDLNGTQAAIRAGYSAKTAQEQASRLLSNVMVAERISELKQDRAEKVSRTAQDVLNDIISVTAQARDEGDLKTALKGLELQGKHLGMFTDRVQQEVSGPNGGPIDNQLTIRLVRSAHAGR